MICVQSDWGKRMVITLSDYKIIFQSSPIYIPIVKATDILY
jgi:hypothetical protein